ncbi:MAG: hypothetical protein ACLFP2_01890 [Candidatus Woesearchaeota archaeon]
MYDVALEILFTLITAFVSFFAFYIYKKTSQRYVFYFSLAFACISISYFLQTILNILILIQLNNLENLLQVLAVDFLNSFGLLVHALLFTMGLVFLLFITFKETRSRLLWLLTILSLSVIFVSGHTLYTFYLVASILLFFITWHYASNYIKYKHKNQLLVTLAFAFLFFGHVHFLISVDHHFFYVIGHVLELISYVLIVWNFLLVFRR